jgi:hypothetical protein
MPTTEVPSHDRVEMASFFNAWKTTLRICKWPEMAKSSKLVAAKVSRPVQPTCQLLAFWRAICCCLTAMS